MRNLAFSLLLLPVPVFACTVFTTTQHGRTFIGCNEDAWSINANVRFEQGRDGGYGAIYFAHFNGHPMRVMSDQLGMNEAGLVFDGLVVGLGPVKRRTGMPAVETADAIGHIMRTCATVQEVEAYLRSVNTGPIVGMLIFCDANGGYLVLEPDTLFTGNDPWYALSNWRMSTCNDPATIPIPRLQSGRQLLMNGTGATLEEAQEVLSTMSVCREKMGEGTLFSVLFDPHQGEAHLFFYHDFSERITFDLKEELAKGDRTVDMASLFGSRPDYDRLKNYLTPFHQRWLFWGMLGFALVAGIAGLLSLIRLGRGLLARVRGRSSSLAVPLLLGAVSAMVIGMAGVLLMKEGVYYFGLADVSSALAFLPSAFIVFAIALLYFAWRERKTREWPLVLGALVSLPMLSLLGYWGLWWP